MVGYSPDPTTDTARRRAAGGRRKLRSVQRMRLQALNLGLSGEVVFVVLHLPGQLYDLHDRREARRRVREMAGMFPLYFSIEDAPSVGLHAHCVVPVELVPYLSECVFWQEVDEERGGLPGKLRYLSKPRDALACRSNHRREVPSLFQKLADERYWQARRYTLESGRKAMYPASGVVNVSSRLVCPPAVLFVLLLEMSRQESESATAEAADLNRRRAAVLTRKPARNAPRRLPAPVPAVPRRWPAAGLPVRRAAPLLIGHARPPPQTSGKPSEIGSRRLSACSETFLLES